MKSETGTFKDSHPHDYENDPYSELRYRPHNPYKNQVEKSFTPSIKYSVTLFPILLRSNFEFPV